MSHFSDVPAIGVVEETTVMLFGRPDRLGVEGVLGCSYSVADVRSIVFILSLSSYLVLLSVDSAKPGYADTGVIFCRPPL